ncbi:glycosyl transferase, group 2 family protein [Rhodopirellula maiorica SM1]|uniref:Glycosyl transferase, group 2 family protein n=1 Tax=Rhodopirellula maiorica SM1 TaxID=1265738 RepID=M5RJM1_9BACT|nr:glycosyl transferase, group 2 family protein [Rhodopirellula maiorica SM1]
MGPSNISVILPTYQRPGLLRLCLASLLQQTLPACQIIVGRRENDFDSAAVIAEFAQQSDGLVRDAIVGPNDNLVCSMNAALAMTTGQLVALTDDDAEFPPDWLQRMVVVFDDESIGGFGGRDIQATNPGEAETVGKLQWFGRIVGNHHLAIGPVRDVDVLKGVNCCFRGDVLREIKFDRRLRGLGNVSNWELAVCFAFARRGYRLVFDPSLEVVHHTGPRQDGDSNNRGGFNGAAHSDSVFNETLLVREHLPLLGRIGFAAWCLLIGTGSTPGLLQFPRLIAKEKGGEKHCSECGSRSKVVRQRFSVQPCRSVNFNDEASHYFTNGRAFWRNRASP